MIDEDRKDVTDVHSWATPRARRRSGTRRSCSSALAAWRT